MKSTSILGRIFPHYQTEGANNTAVHELFEKGSVGILSASCCDPSSYAKDVALKANLQEALHQLDDKRTFTFETITAAQRTLRSKKEFGDEAHRALVEHIMSLFQAHGLSAFPMLIVDRQVMTYGGVPSVDLIREKMQLFPA